MNARVIVAIMNRGVTFSPRLGGVCPLCGTPRAPIRRTMPWEGSLRERYHQCPDCGFNFKSIEEDAS